MKSIFKSLSAVTIVAGLFFGCANSDEYDTPNSTIETVELTPTKTVATIVSETTATTTQYMIEDVIEAYVTSSDEGSNFYNSISFQTIPTDGSQPIGFSVPVAMKYYIKGFTPGRKVYIKLNGLYRAIVDGSMQIGELYQPNPTDAPDVGRISENRWQNYLFLSSTIVNENDFARPLTLAQAAANENLNTLIDLQNVQFADGSLGRTYFDVDSGGGATNHNITDITGGTQRFFRVSSFSDFATQDVASGSGVIRGVMTKFGNDFQFLARVESDIRLLSTRVDTNPPVVGDAITYLGNFTENFESYAAGSATTGQFNFPKYINDPVVGTKFWRARSASGNKYIEMSSFGGTAEVNRTLFIVPVDMTAANTLTFKTKASFYNGNTLKVYYSTNYTPGADIATATLVNITSNFTISDGSSTAFITSGTYNIPAAVTGNGYFIFEYKGSAIAPLITTNMDIDDIVVN